MATLKANVHVGEVDGVQNDTNGWYGPDYGNAEDVPAAVAQLIPNPKAWEDGQPPASDAEDDADTGSGDEPPRSGPGSNVTAWRAHAKHLGLTVPAGAGREEIVALVDQHRAAQD